jgi:hypothetical protein
VLDNLLDPVVLCFVAGLLAGALRSELRLPDALYETLSVYLLLAIGLKGGAQLASSSLAEVVGPIAGTLALGGVIPLIAFGVLRGIGRFTRPDAAAIAAHYGSVSAVTFAVVLDYLSGLNLPAEEYVTVLLVVLEIPAIAVGIVLARAGSAARPARSQWPRLVHELLLGKSIYLLLAGLAIGWISGPARMEGIAPVFVGLFKGALALFLLEMGLVAARRLGELRRVGPFLVGFGVLMPVVSAVLGLVVAGFCGMSTGGSVVLATLAASSSYIAAPAAMRQAVPEANPTLYLTASLGITFPFNIVIGIPLYHRLALLLG